MKALAIHRFIYLTLIGIYFAMFNAQAATITVTANTNWSALGSTPTSSDLVIIKNGATLTVNVTNAVCANMELGGTGSSKGAGTLTFAASGNPILDVSGTVTIGAGKNGGTDCFGVLTMVSGATMKCQGFAITTTTGNAYTAEGTIELKAANTLPSTIVTSFKNLTLNHSGASTTLGGSLTISGTLTQTAGKMAVGSNTLTLQGDYSGSSSNCITLNGSSNITISGSGTIGNLFFDQTTGGTTNKAATFTMNRSSQTASIGNDLQVATSLTLTSGKFGINGQTLTLNGDFSGSSTNCLVGSTTSNLSVGGTGSFTSNLFMEQSTASDTALNQLTMNRSGVTLTLGNKLKLFGTLTPTAGTIASGGNLVMVSNATVNATVANGSGSVTGNVTVQRFIPSSARRWRFLSSPVTSATIADWQGEIHITGPGGATNGFDATSTNAPGIYWYDETITTGDLNTGWTTPTANTNTLTPGKGYRVFVRGTRASGRLDGSISSQDAVTMDVTGTLNDGNINMSPTFNSSGTAANDGWNLLGNPYASAIDWNAFHDGGRTGTDPDFSGTDYAHLDKTVYVFDGSTNSYVSYNAVANSGTLTNGIIPSGAAFFVKATAASPSMTMKNSYKSSTFSSYFKNIYADKDFRIKVIKDSITSDEMIVKYMDEATYTHDMYDSEKLWGSDVNIAAISADKHYQVLQSKPFNGISDTTQLAVYVRQTGSYQLKFVNAGDFASNLPLALIDRYTNTTRDLRRDNVYTFAASMSDARSYGDQRFLLVTGQMPQDTVVVNPPPVQQKATFSLYPTVTSEKITLNSDVAIVAASSIEVRDQLGIIKQQINNPIWINRTLQVDLSALPNHPYFITVKIVGQNPVTLRCIKAGNPN